MSKSESGIIDQRVPNILLDEFDPQSLNDLPVQVIMWSVPVKFNTGTLVWDEIRRQHTLTLNGKEYFYEQNGKNKLKLIVSSEVLTPAGKFAEIFNKNALAALEDVFMDNGGIE